MRYLKMKLNTKKLYDFIKRASLNGIIQTMKMTFGETGLTANVVDLPKTVVTHTSMDISKFEEYTAIGDVYINNTLQFLKYLNTFSDTINIEKTDEYALKISNDTRETVVLLGSNISVENVYEKEPMTIEADVHLELNSTDFKDISRDISLLKTERVQLRVLEEDIFEIEIGKKGETDYILTKIPIVEDHTTTECAFGLPFLSTLTVISGTVQLDLKRDSPMILINNTEDISFRVTIAPMG
jgi:hypothetical protein